jgi:hypothetical protein
VGVESSAISCELLAINKKAIIEITCQVPSAFQVLLSTKIAKAFLANAKQHGTEQIQLSLPRGYRFRIQNQENSEIFFLIRCGSARGKKRSERFGLLKRF